MGFFPWFLPGLKVKRWLLLVFFGVVMAGFGFSLASGATIILSWDLALKDLCYHWLGYRMSAIFGVLIVVAGLACILFGFSRCVRSMIKTLAPDKDGKLLESIYKERCLERGPKIVAIGGGTGLSVLLRGLKEHTSNITAIVTVTDDGGSSGILKGDFDILPPGDIRNCLVALADTESSMRELFEYRFERGQGLAGHSIGNLLLTAMSEMEGDFYKAIQEIAKVLAIRGRVLPSTLTKVTLCARAASGSIIQGETRITNSGESIERVFLKPKKCRPLQEALEAIMEADAVVLGPGSLYTSIIPNLLINGIVESLEKTPATVFYVCNVMTQPGETDGYDAEQHLEALFQHTKSGIVDAIVVNQGEIPRTLLKKYREEGSYPVQWVRGDLENMGVQVIDAWLVDENDFIRHDSKKLARVILNHIGTNNGKFEMVM